MSHSWLMKKKKQDLVDLSKEAGLTLDSALLKDEIVESLDEFLQTNATRLSKNATFEGYYGTGRRSTPFKIRDSSAAPNATSGEEEGVKSVVKARGRRATKIKQEPEDDDAFPSPISAAKDAVSAVSSALSPVVDSALSPFSHNNAASSTRTPAVRRSTRDRKPEIPASPADVADIVEYESNQVAQFVERLYENAGISDWIEYARDALSSVPAVHLTFLALESFALVRAILPFRFAFDIPAIGALHTSSHSVFLPDLFILLTGYWWSTTLLWATTSILIPALFGYFFNLTHRNTSGRGRPSKAGYVVDPLTFAVVKAVATWLVYSQGVNFGLVGDTVAERVDDAIFGGYRAVIIGAGIGGLASLYEAVLRK
ncbi:unnamed protein product [Zymoseptoria tritici ST99CH_1A5]|uniref:Rho termination factor N-terminal domain-containing protein n=1 Tax=Zymoseptoria tritici ST99CH_1A5 TaxID=1276529 RepID=A0A1Y6LW66_ZYMTR|nr:unnamed protein product [Zymoseptoria tritici ST99CH_1A5]